MYVSKKVYAVYNAPEVGEFSRIFVLKVTLQFVRLLYCKLQNKLGDVLVALPMIFLGEQLLLCSPDSRTYGHTVSSQNTIQKQPKMSCQVNCHAYAQKRTSNIEIVRNCQSYFGFKLPREL